MKKNNKHLGSSFREHLEEELEKSELVQSMKEFVDFVKGKENECEVSVLKKVKIDTKKLKPCKDTIKALKDKKTEKIDDIDDIFK
jgi:ferritin